VSSENQQDDYGAPVDFVETVIRCPHCGDSHAQNAQLVRESFVDGEVDCVCGKRINLFRAQVSELLNNKWSSASLSLAGATAVSTVHDFPPGETLTLEWEGCHVPNEARVHYIEARPFNGAGWPILNTWTPLYPARLASKLEIFSRPHSRFTDFGTGVAPHEELEDHVGPTEAEDYQDGVSLGAKMGQGIYLTVYYTTADSPQVEHLVRAAAEFEEKRFVDVVVPANIAAETAISRAAAEALRGLASDKHVKAFLEDGATYSHQLNVLVPLLAHLLKIGRLSDEIRGTLNRLRSNRNDIVHRGVVSQSVSRRDAAEYVVAAFLAVEYAAYLSESVGGARTRGEVP
jgi:hypothetical protein